jgi:hypothetical protein
MSPYRKIPGGVFVMRVPIRSRGIGPIRSCGTNDPDTADDIAALVKRLKKRRDWELLEAVTCSPPRLSLGEIYDADVANRLDELRARLKDVDLAEHLDGWARWVTSNLGDTGTAAMYRAQVTSLVFDPAVEYDDDDRIHARSELTTPRVSQWLATRLKANGEPVSSSYKRKLLYALFSFIAYLREMHLLAGNPIDDIKRPKKGSPKLRWETVANDRRIVDATPADYRSHAAFVKASAAEVSASLAMKGRDVELYVTDRDGYCGLAHVPGTKTETRDRHDVLIEAWARPYLERLVRQTMPNALLWPDITRYKAHYQHQRAAAAVGVEDYTLRDARHSWAVRARKRGVEFEAISEQLGSSVATVHGTYARFKMTTDERHQAQGGAQ